jgi:hypothetical protein
MYSSCDIIPLSNRLGTLLHKLLNIIPFLHLRRTFFAHNPNQVPDTNFSQFLNERKLQIVFVSVGVSEFVRMRIKPNYRKKCLQTALFSMRNNMRIA